MDVKKSVMNDESEIYNRDRYDGLEKNAFKEMNRKDKLQYFKDYYLKFVLIGIGVLCVASVIIYGMTRPVKEKFTIYCAMLDGAYMNPDMMDLYKGDLGEYMVKDNDYIGSRNVEKMVFKTYTDSVEDGLDLSGKFEKHQIDVLIMNRQSFNSYAKEGRLLSLKDNLPDDLYKAIKGDIVKVDNAEDDKEYGISINKDKIQLYNDQGEEYGDAILAIAADSKRLATSIEYVKFVYQLYR